MELFHLAEFVNYLAPGPSIVYSKTTRTVYGPFTSWEAYKAKREELIAKRLKEGFVQSSVPAVDLEKKGIQVEYIPTSFTV